MRISMLATCFAATGALFASTALGQEGSTLNVRPARPAARTAFEYNRYAEQPAAQDSPSDAPPAGESYYTAAADPAAPACCDNAAESCCDNGNACCDNGCNGGCNACGCGCCHDWCDLGEPWVLFDGCCLKKNNITIKGFVDQGFTWNTDDPTDRFNGPLTFNDRSNEYQLNQVWLYVEKAPNTEDCCWDVGGRVDVVYGTDWRFTPETGWEIERDGTRKWNQDHRFYGLAVPQAYAAFKINDLEIDVGRFFTTAAYEVVPSTGNFFYSHAYTHQYFEPFTHTGVMNKYQVTDNLLVHACIMQGWDQFEDINDDPSLLAGFAWTSCDKKTSFAYTMTYGDEANELFFTNTQNRYYQALVLQRQLNDKWKYIAHSDYGTQEEVGGAGTPDAEWYSVTQYLFYTVNDCLSYGARYEWTRDDDGFRIFGVGSAEAAAGVASPMGFIGGGYAGRFQSITVGANYKPHANVVIRPELRYDWYSGLASGVNGRPLPYDTGTSNDQFLLGTDVIFTY